MGASGAVAGVLAGYLVLFPSGQVRALVILGPFIRISRLPALFFILFWFVTQFLSGIAMLGVATAETGGVAYWAHIGGFVGGPGAGGRCSSASSGGATSQSRAPAPRLPDLRPGAVRRLSDF